jgi:hypothetical protein
MWAHLRSEINAEAGLEVHLARWCHGLKSKLSNEDKANIRLLVQAGLAQIHGMNLLHAIVEEK